MKKLFVTFTIIFLAAAASSQDTLWRKGGLLSLNLTQVSLSNGWSAGGENSIAASALINYYANYKFGKDAWDNTFDLGYGMMMQGKDDPRKNDDRIELSSKYGRAAGKKWYYSVLLNFRSQFTPGYNYPNDSVAISRFAAPGYLLLALGMDHKPSDHFSLLISPATLRLVIVNDIALSDARAFGVDSGEFVKTEAGAFLKATLNADLSPNLNIQTSIDLFSNYMEEPQNMDVNWQMLLTLKVSKYIAVSLSTLLIYDHDTKLTFMNDDRTAVDHVGPGTQFKEVLGIGFAYKYAGVKVKKR